LDALRRSLIRNSFERSGLSMAGPAEVDFLMAETRADRAFVISCLTELGLQVSGESGDTRRQPN
jgi:hypothetical protein